MDKEIILYLVTGVIGTAYFVYGWKQKVIVPLMVGLALGAYPYLVQTFWISVLIGIVLIVLPYFWRPDL